MSLKQLVDETTTALMDTIEDYEFSEKQKQAIQAVIEDSIVQAVKQVRKAHNEATIMCCGPEDMLILRANIVYLLDLYVYRWEQLIVYSVVCTVVF